MDFSKHIDLYHLELSWNETENEAKCKMFFFKTNKHADSMVKSDQAL